MVLDPENDEQYVLTPKPVLRAIIMLFQTKQVHSAKNPNIFTAQECGIYSKAELTNSLNLLFLEKRSDITPKLSGKAMIFSYL